MMITLPELAHYSTEFPEPSQALVEPNGLLAFGGDLSVKRLLSAYARGVFPWFSADEPILWWSPDPRGVLPLDELYINKSTKKWLRQSSYKVTINYAFVNVIKACASIPRGPIIADDGTIQHNGTWITQTMIEAYIDLHRAGHAHSIEIWNENGELVGGLYGVSIGGVFCGESMFHIEPNTSKLAFISLVQHMKRHNGLFIDCQLQNPYLASMGVIEVPRELYLEKLQLAVALPSAPSMWSPQEIVL
jgi:leucyl/phenylalanyl-tRNA--protein transferase